MVVLYPSLTARPELCGANRRQSERSADDGKLCATLLVTQIGDDAARDALWAASEGQIAKVEFPLNHLDERVQSRGAETSLPLRMLVAARFCVDPFLNLLAKSRRPENPPVREFRPGVILDISRETHELPKLSLGNLAIRRVKIRQCPRGIQPGWHGLQSRRRAIRTPWPLRGRPDKSATNRIERQIAR